MATQVGVIKKFVDALTKTNKQGTAAVNSALEVIGAPTYAVLEQTFIDEQAGNTKKEFLDEVCGVRLNNTDTGAITGSDAGGSTTKTAKNILSESAKAKTLTAAQYNSFTTKGLTVNITYDTGDGGKAFNNNAKTYLAKQKLVTRALYNWWIPESLDLIDESLGINFTNGRASLNKIDIVFAEDDTSCLKVDTVYDRENPVSIKLTINSGLFKNLTSSDTSGKLATKGSIGSTFYGNKLNESSSFATYLDQLVLQAMAEVALKANVPYVEKLPKTIANGLVEIVGGYDSSSNVLSSFISGSDEIRGYTFVRYLAQKYSDDRPDDALPIGLTLNAKKTILTASTLFSGVEIDLADFVGTVQTVDANLLNSSKQIRIIGNELANSIVGSQRNDTLWGADGNDTIRGNYGNDSLNGGYGNDKLYGEVGNDTLYGGYGNDTLTGGYGYDVFVYNDGKDVITDYTAGEDRIYIESGDITKATTSGDDVIFTVGKGKLTVKGGKYETITVTNSNRKTYTTIVGGLKLTDDSPTNTTIKSSVEYVNARERTKAAKIVGNALNNSVYGGTGNDTIYGKNGYDSLFGNNGSDYLSGGDGRDTLWGGDGNDTLIGGNGKDVFRYTGGNDVITDYEKGELIYIPTNRITSVVVDNNDAIFSFNKGSLTVKDGLNKIVYFVSSSNNEFTYYVDGDSSNLVLTDASPDEVTIGAAVKNVDATARTKTIKITANDIANSINGGSGKDVIYGENGNDSILGNAGNDELYGGDGNDTLYGGYGNDTLNGGYGNDTIYGNAGTDKLYGDTGNDLIKGGAGNDSIWGGKGNDTLWGGTGADVFYYDSGDGNDVIYSFGDNDMLKITSTFSATYDSSTDELYFKVGNTNNAITLRDIAAETFNINGNKYYIDSKDRFVEK